MILRRMTDAIKSQNWFQVTIEVAIVVLGIFIGLQVDDWNTAHQEKAEGEEYLERLYEDLKYDVGHFDVIKKAVKNKQFGLFNIENIIKTSDIGWTGQITHFTGEKITLDIFGALEFSTDFSWSFPNVRTTTFMDLQNSGNLALIDNSDVRFAIAYYFEESLNAHSRTLARTTGYSQKAYKMIDGGARTSFAHVIQDDLTIYDPQEFDPKLTAMEFIERAREEDFQELLRAEKNYAGFLLQMIKEQQNRTQILINLINDARE